MFLFAKPLFAKTDLGESTFACFGKCVQPKVFLMFYTSEPESVTSKVGLRLRDHASWLPLAVVALSRNPGSIFLCRASTKLLKAAEHWYSRNLQLISQIHALLYLLTFQKAVTGGALSHVSKSRNRQAVVENCLFARKWLHLYTFKNTLKWIFSSKRFRETPAKLRS